MRHIKLFEEFILEGDPLGDIMGGGDEEAKEDPLEKKKKEDQRAENKAKEKHEKMVDKKLDTIDDLLKKLPEVEEKIGDKIRKAIETKDRVAIHNCVLDLIYIQQDYAEKGNDEIVAKITPIKTKLDGLDKSYTSSKMM